MKHRGQIKVMTHYRSIKPERNLEFVIEETINELGERMTVESAKIIVERSTSDHPPIRANIFIETPGPDIEVEARDYTGAAAYNKAWRVLQKRAETKANHNDSKRQSYQRSARPTNHQSRHQQ